MGLAVDEPQRTFRAGLGAGAGADAEEGVDDRMQRNRLAEAGLPGFLQSLGMCFVAPVAAAEIKEKHDQERRQIQRDQPEIHLQAQRYNDMESPSLLPGGDVCMPVARV